MGPGDPRYLRQPGIYLKTLLPVRQFRKTVQETFRVPALRVYGSCRCECRVQYCSGFPPQCVRGVPGTPGTGIRPFGKEGTELADPISADFSATCACCRKSHQLRKPACRAGIIFPLFFPGIPYGLYKGCFLIEWIPVHGKKTGRRRST